MSQITTGTDSVSTLAVQSKMLADNEFQQENVIVSKTQQDKVTALVNAGYNFKFEVSADFEGTCTMTNDAGDVVSVTQTQNESFDYMLSDATQDATDLDSPVEFIFHALFNKAYAEWEKRGKPQSSEAWPVEA